MNNQSELNYENQNLEQVITLAKKQLDKSKEQNENNSESILSLKKDLRDNTSHSISGLWNSQNFEDLITLSQFDELITNEIRNYDEIAKEIMLLERLIQSPYFARVDFKYDGEKEFEKIYIGRSSLVKNKTYEIAVYDWRSPVASLFYRFGNGKAYYNAPNGKICGEINLKRQFEIKDGILEYYFDADVEIMDEFLRKMLSQNTSTKMKTIIETIQKEQDAVIRDMENDLMMVQGVAGSGKTSIALHRAAYLMYQGLSTKLSANNILIISPNSIFEMYISNVLPELGEDNIVSLVFEEILMKILKKGNVQPRNQFIELLLTNTTKKDIRKASIEFKTSKSFMKIIDRFINDIPHKWIKYEDIYCKGRCLLNKNLLKDKVLSIKKELPLGYKMELLEEFILEAFDNIGEKHKFYTFRNNNQRFTELNIEDLYKNLINNKEYFYSLAMDIELPNTIKEILNYTKENLNSNFIYYDDATVIAYMKLKIEEINEFKNIKQVVIDEAQDYYPIHYEIMNLLFPHSKYTILGDINQTLEKQEDLSLYQEVSQILKKKKSILITMDKSFRCTNEILTYSQKFITQNNNIKSFNRNGAEPKVYTASNMQSFNNIIISEIKTCKDNGYQSIGLICKTNKNAQLLYKRIKDITDVNLIKSDNPQDLKGTFIIPVYMSKGLEFDAVLICDVDNLNYNSEDDKKLLYIASTRALHRLNLFYEGEVSNLLDL